MATCLFFLTLIWIAFLKAQDYMNMSGLPALNCPPFQIIHQPRKWSINICTGQSDEDIKTIIFHNQVDHPWERGMVQHIKIQQCNLLCKQTEKYHLIRC